MHTSSREAATGRLTLTGAMDAKAGEPIMTTATPTRAIAISIPIASAISCPVNHFTIPRLTVIPAISAPQPKIMNPIAESLAEAGMPSYQGVTFHHACGKFRMPSMKVLNEEASKVSVTANQLIAAPSTITPPERIAVKRTPILSRIIPAKMRKNTKTLRKGSEPAK